MDIAKHNLYKAALMQMAKDNPTKETMARLHAFMNWSWWSRKCWIDWVEENPDLPLNKEIKIAMVVIELEK